MMNLPEFNRRSILKSFAVVAASSLAPVGSPLFGQTEAKKAAYKISLAEWSLNKRIFKRGGAEPLDHLDFAKTAKSLGIDAVEYVNQCFEDKTAGESYLKEMKTRAEGEGVASLLIMVDREGNLGEPDADKRKQTVENHLKWLDAAKYLGCHCIRVNAASDAKLSWDEQAKLAADGLHQLCVEGEKRGLDVVVENHGGLSSNGKWLTQVMKLADHARVGVLPDLGNFYTDRAKGELYNPYLGLREFMPWVKKSISAKAFDWDTGAGKYYTEDRREGREMTLDYERLIKIIASAGYTGYIGIEYEGDKHSEEDGIKLTLRVLEELREKLA